MDFIGNYLKEFSKICMNMPEDSIKKLINKLGSLREVNGRLFILGVGGSAFYDSIKL